MKVTAVKTPKITPGGKSIYQVLDECLPSLQDGSIVAVTSKIVAICEGSVEPLEGTNKEQLIRRESELFLTKETSRLGHRTIAKKTLVSGAGIDESNAGGRYILLPNDPQKTANDIRSYLKNKHKLKDMGVLITDSKSTPLRLGASGIALGWSGFKALKDYRGKPDLFGRPYKVSRADIAGGLAAAAVLVMGEGAEQTPIAVMKDVPFVEFQVSNPTPAELEYMNIRLEDDIFAPMLTSMDWQAGGQAKD